MLVLLKDFLTVEETAALVGCTEAAVCKAFREGRLQGIRRGKRTLWIPVKAAKEYAKTPATTGRPRKGFKPAGRGGKAV